MSEIPFKDYQEQFSYPQGVEFKPDLFSAHVIGFKTKPGCLSTCQVEGGRWKEENRSQIRGIYEAADVFFVTQSGMVLVAQKNEAKGNRTNLVSSRLLEEAVLVGFRAKIGLLRQQYGEFPILQFDSWLKKEEDFNKARQEVIFVNPA